MKPLLILDLETTGLSPEKDSIIEYAWLQLDPQTGEEIARSTSLLALPAGAELPAKIQHITRITPQMLASAPTLDSLRDDLQARIDQSIVVGHNIDFDLRFLATNGFRIHDECCDTYLWAQVLLPQASSYKLTSLSRTFKLSHSDAHRAMSDVEATAQVYLLLADLFLTRPDTWRQKMQMLADRLTVSLPFVSKQDVCPRQVPVSVEPEFVFAESLTPEEKALYRQVLDGDAPVIRTPVDPARFWVFLTQCAHEYTTPVVWVGHPFQDAKSADTFTDPVLVQARLSSSVPATQSEKFLLFKMFSHGADERPVSLRDVRLVRDEWMLIDFYTSADSVSRAWQYHDSLTIVPSRALSKNLDDYSGRVLFFPQPTDAFQSLCDSTVVQVSFGVVSRALTEAILLFPLSEFVTHSTAWIEQSKTLENDIDACFSPEEISHDSLYAEVALWTTDRAPEALLTRICAHIDALQRLITLLQTQTQDDIYQQKRWNKTFTFLTEKHQELLHFFAPQDPESLVRHAICQMDGSYAFRFFSKHIFAEFGDRLRASRSVLCEFDPSWWQGSLESFFYPEADVPFVALPDMVHSDPKIMYIPEHLPSVSEFLQSYTHTHPSRRALLVVSGASSQKAVSESLELLNVPFTVLYKWDVRTACDAVAGLFIVSYADWEKYEYFYRGRFDDVFLLRFPFPNPSSLWFQLRRDTLGIPQTKEFAAVSLPETRSRIARFVTLTTGNIVLLDSAWKKSYARDIFPENVTVLKNGKKVSF